MAKRSGGRVLLEGVLCIGAAIALSYLRFHTGLKFGGFDGYISGTQGTVLCVHSSYVDMKLNSPYRDDYLSTIE